MDNIPKVSTNTVTHKKNTKYLEAFAFRYFMYTTPETAAKISEK
ncbi:hypothetical protein [Aquimarina pacifica]|nr:hypothetical protein [Aquimarina pacifica]